MSSTHQRVNDILNGHHTKLENNDTGIHILHEADVGKRTLRVACNYVQAVFLLRSVQWDRNRVVVHNGGWPSFDCDLNARMHHSKIFWAKQGQQSEKTNQFPPLQFRDAHSLNFMSSKFTRVHDVRHSK
jgi:hypothetical protein